MPSTIEQAFKCRFCGLDSTLRCTACQDAWYCTKEHQVEDWKASHKRFCLTKTEREEIVKFARERTQTFETMDEEQKEFDLGGMKAMQDFINSHTWPTEATILQYISSPNTHYHHLGYSRMMQAPGAYRHSLATRLYKAMAIEPMEARIKEFRSIGYLLDKRGGIDLMQCYYYLINHILCGGDIWPEPRDQRLAWWTNGYCEVYWNRVGSWMK